MRHIYLWQGYMHNRVVWCESPESPARVLRRVFSRMLSLSIRAVPTWHDVARGTWCLLLSFSLSSFFVHSPLSTLFSTLLSPLPSPLYPLPSSPEGAFPLAPPHNSQILPLFFSSLSLLLSPFVSLSLALSLPYFFTSTAHFSIL